MPSFDQNIQTIETALYGKEVRSAIAEGLQQAASTGGGSGGINVNSVDDIVSMIDTIAENGYNSSIGTTSQIENDSCVTPLRNSVVRGKYLGPTVTSEQLTAIETGKFTGLALGDYWANSEDDRKYIIKDFDYYFLPEYFCPWNQMMNYSLVPFHHIVVGTAESVGTTAYDTSGIQFTMAYIQSDLRSAVTGSTVSNGRLLDGTPVNNIPLVERLEFDLNGDASHIYKDRFFPLSLELFLGFSAGLYSVANNQREKKQLSFYKKCGTGMIGRRNGGDKSMLTLLRDPICYFKTADGTPSVGVFASGYGQTVHPVGATQVCPFAINYVLCGRDCTSYNQLVSM